MARDIAQRELDQGGFKISNLGNPTAPGDATKTDNTTVPLPNAGALMVTVTVPVTLCAPLVAVTVTVKVPADLNACETFALPLVSLDPSPKSHENVVPDSDAPAANCMDSPTPPVLGVAVGPLVRLNVGTATEKEPSGPATAKLPKVSAVL